MRSECLQQISMLPEVKYNHFIHKDEPLQSFVALLTTTIAIGCRSIFRIKYVTSLPEYLSTRTTARSTQSVQTMKSA